ncbi:MAG: EF-hand domain-containing protein [Pseudomonadota bacterium]
MNEVRFTPYVNEKEDTIMKKAMLAALLSTGLATAGFAAIAQGGHERGHGRLDMEQADLNGDGAISREELDAARAEGFAVADTDGSGTLSFEEFSAAGDQKKAERKAERRERHFTEMDADGDGQVTIEEQAAHADKRTDKMFEHIDTDADGLITQEERDAAREDARGKFGKGRLGDRD